MISGIRRWFASMAGTPTPATYATTAGAGPEYFKETTRNEQTYRAWQRIYLQGGHVAQMIDLYALMMLRRGYTLVGSDGDVRRVQDELNRLKISSVLQYAITRCLTYGFSLQEIVPPAKGSGIARILKRWPGMFEIETDVYGDITRFSQVLQTGQKKRIEREVMFFLSLIESDDAYGISLIQRAHDEIYRDVRTAEGISKAIERHGTGKHWHKLGTEDKPATEADVVKYREKFKTLKEDSEIITSHNVAITDMDRSGIQNAQQYSDLTLQRLCSAMGVPGELIGLRVGTTDNTAVSRIDAFFDQIQTFQLILAEAVNEQIIDRITGRPGAVRIEFADASPRDEVQRAQWITQIMNANRMDPLWIGENWIKQQFSIPFEDVTP